MNCNKVQQSETNRNNLEPPNRCLALKQCEDILQNPLNLLGQEKNIDDLINQVINDDRPIDEIDKNWANNFDTNLLTPENSLEKPKESEIIEKIIESTNAQSLMPQVIIIVHYFYFSE